ncbi:glycosyltransferase [Altericista sp. CCNU0014]|uniref:glycosyltransferase n=1 Tax=Altericista sp. CCNU0014 TaxID=3082949 RepID=UPI00384B400D
MVAQPTSEMYGPVFSQKISLCAIVKDEETLLPRCLQSVQNIVDETIVVDTGSTDRTVEIARQFGATVYQHAWNDDFAEARNESLRRAKGDWILVLDADETFIPGCFLELQRAICSPDCLAVTLLRQEIGAQQNPYSLICRLFRRHPQLQFQRPYHETIDESVAALMARESHWTVVSLPTPAIAHDGYSPEAIAQHRKSERAERIMSRYLQAHPQDAYICSKLGALYVSQGRNPEGLALLQQGLALQPEAPAIAYELHYHLGLACAANHQLDLAQQHYEQALAAKFPDVLKLAAYINLAALYSDRHAWTEAEALLTRALKIQPECAIAHYNLGLIYKAQGNFSAAIAAYQKAIALQPNSAEAHQNLGVVYFKQGQVLESLAAFQQAIALHSIDNPAEAQRLRQTLADMGWQV